MRKRVLLGLSLALVFAASALPASAQGGDQVVTVVDGLRNPRQLASDADGNVYVAEAGVGKKGCRRQGCHGFTSRVTQVTADGTVSRPHTGLWSAAARDGSFAAGATSVAVDGEGGLSVILGSGPPSRRDDVNAQMGRLLQITGATTREAVANLMRFEKRNNPAGDHIESNPYGLYKDGDVWLVADAAGNSLNQVDAEGKITNVAVFPQIRVRGEMRDAVPTSVTEGPDGAYYVGELGGEGNEKARIWRVVPGETPTVYARGFTMVVGLDFGPDGSLYVIELVENAAAFETFQGALQVIPPGGEGPPTELADDQLLGPGGVTVTDDGRIYVSNCSVAPGRTTRTLPCKGHLVEVIPAP